MEIKAPKGTEFEWKDGQVIVRVPGKPAFVTSPERVASLFPSQVRLIGVSYVPNAGNSKAIQVGEG